jgi:hypothetical protein
MSYTASHKSGRPSGVVATQIITVILLAAAGYGGYYYYKTVMVGPEAIVKKYIAVAAEHSPKALLPYLSAASVVKITPMIPTHTDDSQAVPTTVVPKFTVGKFKLEGADAVVPVDLEVPGQNGAAASTIHRDYVLVKEKGKWLIDLDKSYAHTNSR